jgi:hypothetical protein
MDPITTASVASKVVAPGKRELRKLRRRNEVQNLYKAVATTLASDYRVPAQHKRAVMKTVKGLPLDPNVGGCLRALLEGDSSVLPATEARATELLRFPAEVDDRAVVVAFMEALRANVIPAKRDTTAALSTIYREQLASSGVLTDIRRQLGAATTQGQEGEQRIVEEIRSHGRQGGAAAFSLITGETTLSPQTPKVLEDLGRADSSVAQQAGTALAEGGGPGLASWVRDSGSSLRDRGLQTSVHVGRLLMAEDQFAAAEQQFVIAAEDDGEDPARQWVRAANAALQDDRPTRSEELLQTARSLADRTHPALALADVQSQKLTPTAVLERLEDVEPVIDADTVGLASARAQARLLKEELDFADEALGDAERVDPEEPRVRELRALWHLQHAHRHVVENIEIDPADLTAAEAAFLVLRKDMQRRGRGDESGAMLSRALEALLIGKQFKQASGLLDEATEAERHGSARLALARQALLCERSELALELVRAGPKTDIGEAIEASVNIVSNIEDAQEEALKILDRLLFSTDVDVQVEAALARAVACLDRNAPAEWSDRAGEILTARDAEAADILHGRAHLAKREFGEAEAILRRHADKPEGLNALIDAAAMQDDFETALQRSDARLRQRHDVAAVLQHARLLSGAGRQTDALKEFSEVAGAPEALLPGEREDAFFQAVSLAQTLKRYAEMEALSGEAIAREMTSEHFHWGRALARFMLSRHSEALRELDEAHIEPSTLGQAELLARILYQSETPNDALRRNVELSARFGNPEGLEALLIVMSPRADELDDATAAAIQKSLETFAERFPDSAKIVQREIPDTEEGIRQLLIEMAPAGDRGQEFFEGIKDGSTVTAVLAAVHKRSVSELWAALTMLPTAYGDTGLEDLEFQDARKSLASPVVFDPSSLSVLALLGDDVAQIVLRALPGSQLAQATLEDADRGVNPMNDPRSPAGSVLTEPTTGEPIVIPIDVADASRRAKRQQAHARLALALEAEPDAAADSDDEMERALLDDESMDAALRTWAATLTVAARRGLPVLSDDRRVRLYARGGGLPSFGTLTFLRALVDTGDLAERVYADARLALLEAGSIGLHPDGDELTRVARKHHWEPNRAIYTLLTDPTLWEPDAIRAWGAVSTLLSSVRTEAPEKLGPWVARLVDAAKQAKPHLDLDTVCFGLVATAWGWTSASPAGDRELLQAVIEAVRDLPRYLGESTQTDPVDFALARYGNASAKMPQAQRAIFALRAMSLLRVTDQMRALALLWE